tara:strand:+ start:2200 stop:2550 length:351 start_codon:yes stop_codon:yes gene_type:complete
MATNDRLAKRVKKIEQWIEENEEMGGPKGYLDTMAGLYSNARDNAVTAQQAQQRFEQMRAYIFEFLKQEDMAEDWDEFLKEKDNAVQEQPTEEVSVQEEAESSKEASEAPVEEKDK